MKLKTILILAVIILLIFLIYLTTLDRKVYYLNLGDELALGKEDTYGETIEDYLKSKNKLEKYIFEFSTSDYRTTDLIRDIQDNKKIYINSKTQTIKNALIKADLVTLSIGSNDIYYKITTAPPKECYEYIDQVLVDLEDLFELIREYCKEDIYMLNYYNAYRKEYDEIFDYMNDKLEDLSKLYHIQIIDVSSILKNKTMDSRLPNLLEYQKISDRMIELIDQTLLR